MYSFKALKTQYFNKYWLISGDSFFHLIRNQIQGKPWNKITEISILILIVDKKKSPESISIAKLDSKWSMLTISSIKSYSDSSYSITNATAGKICLIHAVIQY